MLFGLVYGGLQDALALVRGRPVGYIELGRRKLGMEPLATEPVLMERPI